MKLVTFKELLTERLPKYKDFWFDIEVERYDRFRLLLEDWRVAKMIRRDLKAKFQRTRNPYIEDVVRKVDLVIIKMKPPKVETEEYKEVVRKMNEHKEIITVNRRLLRRLRDKQEELIIQRYAEIELE